MYAEITAALNSARLLGEIISASKDLRNFNELSAAVSEVHIKLSQAIGVALASQEKQAALASRVGELEEEIVQIKNWESHAKNYVLQAVARGIFAYVYKPAVQGTQPRHWSCVKCFQQHKPSLLQFTDRRYYKCSSCGSIIEPWTGGGPVSIDSAYL